MSPKQLEGPISAVQFLAMDHPYTANRERSAVIRNQEKTLGQVGGMTETWANRYLIEHPCGRKLWVETAQEHRGTTITELEAIVDDCVIRCESCGDATNNADPFCNGPICLKSGD